jgi:hypothetical protein
MLILRLGAVLAFAVVLAVAAVVASANTVIDTTGSWHDSDYVWPFGNGGTATFGQTITAPQADTRLESFSFFMWVDPAAVFRGYVFAWDGAKAAGSPHYVTGDTSTTEWGVFQEITFAVGEVDLVPDATYVLFASVSQTPGDGYGAWGHCFADAYPGGSFAYLNNDSNPSLWTTANWVQNWNWNCPAGGGSGGDLAFRAEFSPLVDVGEPPTDPSPSPIPEPMTLASLLLACGGLGAYLRRRAGSGPAAR